MCALLETEEELGKNLLIVNSRNWLGIPILISRTGAAEDIAHAVSFFASEAAQYVTGQTLHVSGGMFMP